MPTSTVISGGYYIVGKTLFLNFYYNYTATTGGSAGSGVYLYPIPGGNQIDTTRVTIGSTSVSTTGSIVGNGYYIYNGSTDYYLVVKIYDSTRLMLYLTFLGGASRGFQSSTFGEATLTAPVNLSFTATIPII